MNKTEFEIYTKKKFPQSKKNSKQQKQKSQSSVQFNCQFLFVYLSLFGKKKVSQEKIEREKKKRRVSVPNQMATKGNYMKKRVNNKQQKK